MPPRWLSVMIVGFWLATVNWMFWRDLWPTLEPGQPPPYSIDLEEEAQQDHLQVRWTVFHNDRHTFTARTWVAYNEDDDTFALEALFTPRTKGGDAPLGIARLLTKMQSTCTVGRRGELRRLAVHVEVAGGEASVGGELRDGRFTPRVRLVTALGTREFDLAPAEVSFHGSVLVPMHPVNRIERLRPGRKWRMPLVDPLAASVGGDAVTYLAAHVLPESRPLDVEQRTFDCHVIEYKGDGQSGLTWVEKQSGLVLRQEVRQGDDHWVLQRETNLPSAP